jgi:dolichol-phosphate mannosyltransferase
MNVSTIVPARNEAGRLEEVISKILNVSCVDEIVIVEGGSNDGTWDVAAALMLKHPRKVHAIKQSRTGKFNAVLEAAEHCLGELVLIWDADDTVSAEDNEKMIQIAVTNYCGVIGNRLNGEIFFKAMPRANLIGNHLFAYLWAPVFGMNKVDCFCGSKIFPREVYFSIPAILRKLDNYGDLSLITTAKLLGFEIKNIPVDYYPRQYGVTGMKPWRTSARFFVVSLISYCYLLGGVFSKKNH